MELSSINGCVVTTTVIDRFGELHHEKKRHTRVTRQSIKRLLQAELADAPAGHAAISTCAALTRVDDFLGIEVIQQEGSVEEMGVVELQRSIVDQIRKLGGGVLPTATARSFERIRRPMTRTSHGAIVEKLDLGPDSSGNIQRAFSAGLDALDRSLDLSATADRLGVQWTKLKMLDIRSDANVAYLDAQLLRSAPGPDS